MAGQNCFHRAVLRRPPHSHRGTLTSHMLHRCKIKYTEKGYWNVFKVSLQKSSVFLEVAIFTVAWVPPRHYYAGYFPYYRNGCSAPMEQKSYISPMATVCAFQGVSCSQNTVSWKSHHITRLSYWWISVLLPIFWYYKHSQKKNFMNIFLYFCQFPSGMITQMPILWHFSFQGQLPFHQQCLRTPILPMSLLQDWEFVTRKTCCPIAVWICRCCCSFVSGNELLL